MRSTSPPTAAPAVAAATGWVVLTSPAYADGTGATVPPPAGEVRRCA